MIRGVILFTLCILLFMTVAGGLMTAQHTTPTLAEEHRLTALETAVALMANDLHDIKDAHKWETLKTIALAAIAAFGGMDAMKRKRKAE